MATTRSTLLRLASQLPKGDVRRRAILSSLRSASPETDAKLNRILVYLKGDPFKHWEGPPRNLLPALQYLLWTWSNDLGEFARWVSLVKEFAKEEPAPE